MPLLRSRRARYRRRVARMAAQVRRARTGAVPRAGRRRRRGRRVVTDQLTLFEKPGDQPARDEIATRLDATLFVEAGAGTGKTAALVERVVALVSSGVPMSAIAAITFTEKAAAELRDRVRRELVRRELTDALDDLDAAAIC